MATTIGIDLGGTKTLAVRMENSEIVDEAKLSTPATDDLVGNAAEAVRAVWSDDVAAIGIGVAGLVEWPTGVFVWGPHVAGTRVPVREGVASAFGVPVVVDNDANVGVWGERHLGVARGYDNVLLVTLGTGIGGAMILDGRIHRGSSFAGEWGHMIYQPGGLQCSCGKRGCWETVASGPALVRLAREFIEQNPEGGLAMSLGDEALTGETVTRAADAGSETARNLVAQVGEAFGRGLCNLIAVLDPDVIVVGGGLGSVGESLLAPARRIAADALHGGSHRMLPPILVAGLGARASGVGAALLAEDLATGRLSLGSARV
ncbi:MAG: ROK family protein [Acidimicrobiia bacterium]